MHTRKCGSQYTQSKGTRVVLKVNVYNKWFTVHTIKGTRVVKRITYI